MKNSNLERASKKQKLGVEDDNHQPENRMEGLPGDIVFDIVSRLPVKSIHQFTIVCKTFRNLSRDPNLIRIHQSRAEKNNPCLIFHGDNPLINHLYFVDFPDHDENKERVGKFDTPFSNSIADFNVVGSCEGILCLVDSVNDIVYIYNPFIRKYKELPSSIKFQVQAVIYGFGFHPITKEYKVIRIVYYVENSKCKSEVQIISLCEKKWRSLGKIPYQLDHGSTVALVNGRLHWVRTSYIYCRRNDGRIISFDISDELFREVSTPDCVDRTTAGGCHLAILSGCLSIVVPVQNRLGGFDIWMMKEYNVKESWVKQFHIGPYYSPRLLEPFLRVSHTIWDRMLNMRAVRVLCLLKNGEILIEYLGRSLVSYNPETGRFKELTFLGMPRLYKTWMHICSLKWID